jgi:hypothetical protein
VGEAGVVALLAEAGWAEADLSLARALQEAAVLQADVERNARARMQGAAKARADAMAAQSLALVQSLAVVARHRGLAVSGRIDDVERFDRGRHVCTPAPKGRWPRVKLQAPAVERRIGDAFEIVLAARAAPVRQRKGAAP